MLNNKIYLDFHIIQTVPPSCVNRDDTGSPKTAYYGGIRRARISSQCWKSAMRKMFGENFDEATLGIRTKRIVEIVAEEIKKLDNTKDHNTAMDLARSIINTADVQTQANKNTGIEEARALFFMTIQQAKNLANLALQPDFTASAVVKDKKQKKETGNSQFKKAAKEALNSGNGIDIAFFGRMVADDPSLNVDASVQVAHAISTHKIDNEFDYYTAHDDRAPEDNAGAGMLGTVEFNSATLYRFATIAVHNLYDQLAQDADVLTKAIREFTRAFIFSMPTGKINSFANQTIPEAVLVTVRTDRPLSLADAYEEPVRTDEAGGFAKNSIKKLAKHAEQLYKNYDCPPTQSWFIGEYWGHSTVSLNELLEKIALDIQKRLITSSAESQQ